MGIPRAPLALALAGLLPFFWGTITYLFPDLALWGANTFGPQYVSIFVLLSYGTVILAFMSGILWGFATRADGKKAAVAYSMAVVPALWAFFMTGGGPVSGAVNLMFGFVGVLILDFAFHSWGLTPPWWLRLRVLITTIVLICLGIGVFL
jgi:hypothetical protein